MTAPSSKLPLRARRGDMLTPREAATLIGISERTMRYWCERGWIAFERTKGGHLRIAAVALTDGPRPPTSLDVSTPAARARTLGDRKKRPAAEP